MLTDETIICVAPDPWVGLWRNRHQIMTRLARTNTVLYVEPRLYLWETLRRFSDGRLRPADVRRPLAEHVQDGLWVYHDPYDAPYAGRLSGGRLTAGLRRRAMRAVLRTLGGGRPILWLLRPFHADLIGQQDEKLVVYHVTDEYSAHPSVTDPRAFARQEQSLLRRADLVIVTSPGLQSDKRRHNPHTYLVPNAVDYHGFQRALTDIASAKITAALAHIPRPRIGYAGALNEKLDYGLIAHIARARPDWFLVLVGKLDLVGAPGKADGLRGLPNVFWTGSVPVSEVPAAIANLDVCLLPYEHNPWTANIDSLKLYEYLACGKPVVGTDLPALQRFRDVVRIADDPDAFVAEIAAALAPEDPAAVAVRKARAAANTWEERVSQIERLLADALAQKQATP